jgi:hypothetical protein
VSVYQGWGMRLCVRGGACVCVLGVGHVSVCQGWGMCLCVRSIEFTSVSKKKGCVIVTLSNSGIHLPNVLETGKLEQTNPKWAYIEVPRPPVVLGYWPEIKEPVGHSKL